jgi:hypothetical protein
MPKVESYSKEVHSQLPSKNMKKPYVVALRKQNITAIKPHV